jgi:tripartite-type tricarboxylate transporter receptor subunit TctC
MPELPTVNEGGQKGFDHSTWWGLVAPAAVGKDVVSRLHAETVRTLGLPDVKERIAANGADVVGNSPAEFAAFIRNERDKYARLAREANIKLE